MHTFPGRAASVFVTSLAIVGLLVTQAAAANCGLTGNWHVNGMLAFGGGQSVIDCTFAIKGTGQYTSTNCGSWTIHQRASLNGAANGVIRADANCKLSGVLKAPGFADTAIRGGFVNGNYAVLVGTRGNANNPVQVRMITLIRE